MEKTIMGKISPNIQNVIQHIGSQDLLSANLTEIDSQKEYNLLGQYLNGSYSINNCSKESLSKKEYEDGSISNSSHEKSVERQTKEADSDSMKARLSEDNKAVLTEEETDEDLSSKGYDNDLHNKFKWKKRMN